MYRFLLTRRWILITLAAIVISIACVRLGFWQLDRYHQRAASNAATEAAMHEPAVPVGDLLTVDESAAGLGRDEAGEPEWRQVRVQGHYDAENQVVLRYRRVDGQSGVHVLTPLVTEQGPALLVDRGFVAAAAGSNQDRLPDPPAPPSGEVEIVARLRASEEARGLGTAPESKSIRYVNMAALAKQLPYPVYDHWAELVDQDPGPEADQLQLIPAPELSAGPSLAYAIQWWVFALIGMIGYVVLARGEARGETRSGRREPEPGSAGLEPSESASPPRSS